MKVRPKISVRVRVQRRRVVYFVKPQNGMTVEGDVSILYVACPVCGSKLREPCWFANGYAAGVHFQRRRAFTAKRRAERAKGRTWPPELPDAARVAAKRHASPNSSGKA